MKPILQTPIFSKGLLRVATGVALAVIVHLDVAAQSGYKFRTKQSGSWTDITTWERMSVTNGTTWSNLPNGVNPPNQNAGPILIQTGHEVTVLAKSNADELVIEPGATLNVTDTLNIWDAGNATDMIVNGVVKNSGLIQKASTSVTIEFNANSFYRHLHTGSFGKIPVAFWDPNSTVEISGLTSPSDGALLSSYNQEFGNVTWNTPDLAKNINLLGAISKVNGNLNLVTTNEYILILGNSTAYNNATTAYTLNVGGNLNITDGIVNLAGAAIAFEAKLNLAGDLNITGAGNLRSANTNTASKIVFNGMGKTITLVNTLPNTSITGANLNFEVASGASLSLDSDFPVSAPRSFVVNGELLAKANTIKGTGNFVLNFGSAFGVGSPAGITTSGATGNVQVTGIRSFSGLAAYTYNGTTPQSTGNGLPVNVSDLIINNNAGVTLSAPITVSNQLAMADGILKTNGHTITIGSSGFVAMPAFGKTSFVEGSLTQTVESTSTVTLNFPIGKNGFYRPITLEISQANANPTTYSAEQFEGTYPVSRALPASNTLDRISAVRYFNITQTPAAPLNEGIVTLSYGLDDGVLDPDMLSIAKSTGSGTWVDLDGTASYGSLSEAGTVVAMFTEFSDFILANKAGGPNPLPVELQSFTAKGKDKFVELNWITATEKNSEHFEIERSVDAKVFAVVGKVAGAGTSSELKRYHFLDKTVKAGLFYYRLKQTDYDGTYSYSETKAVMVSSRSEAIAFYPNPATSVLNLETLEEDTQVKVVSMLGREVIIKTVSGPGTTQLDVSALPAGTYQLITRVGQKQTVSKFIKL